MSRISLLASLFVGASLIVGCGGSSDAPKREYAKVSGKVTYKGEPVKSGTISFQPASGIPIVADLQADGSYSLEGVVGPNTVMVNNRTPDPGPNAADREKWKADVAAAAKANAVAVPESYALPSSPLKYEVKAGENTGANFDIPGA